MSAFIALFMIFDIVMKPNDRQLAWKTNDCIVAKSTQYSFDYVYINIVATRSLLVEIVQKLELVWNFSQTYIITVRLTLE